MGRLIDGGLPGQDGGDRPQRRRRGLVGVQDPAEAERFVVEATQIEDDRGEDAQLDAAGGDLVRAPEHQGGDREVGHQPGSSDIAGHLQAGGAVEVFVPAVELGEGRVVGSLQA
jgi:hypothetical protein